jgi:CubicO group peptidase (beta-lactamase class C family)
MRQRKKIRNPSIAVLALISAILVFQPACRRAPENDATAVSAIREDILQALEGKILVGLSLAAALEGRIVLAEGYGLSDRKAALQVAPDTMFAIGSITKQFTAVCVLLLEQEKKLTVSDRVAAYFPHLTRAEDISLLDLMNHVSGYQDYYPLDFVDRRLMQPTSVDDVIDTYAGAELDFEPGTRYSYSNTGYLILGRVVEKASGLPFEEFLSRRILEPLDLRHTAFEPEPTGPRFAKGHMSFLFSPPEPVPLEAPGWIYAAGGMFSTPSDLVKWNNALFSGKVLNKEYLRIMTAPRRLDDGSFSNYGCGLSIGERNGLRFYAHSGAVNGYYAVNWYVPSSRSSLVLFSNLSSYAEVESIFNRLVADFLIKPAKPGAIKPEAAASETKAARTQTGTPEVSGPSVAEQAARFFASLQAGRVDRSLLGEEFNWFLTDRKIEKASVSLKPFGEPVSIRVESIAERSGMEVSKTSLEFPSGSLRILMYRTPDGKVQQFFVQRY